MLYICSSFNQPTGCSFPKDFIKKKKKMTPVPHVNVILSKIGLMLFNRRGRKKKKISLSNSGNLKQ